MGIKERSSPYRNSTLSSASRAPRSDGYYLECRKDAQCQCSMCKASISATLDLLQPFKPSTKENQPWPPPFPCSPPSSPSLSKRRSLYTQNPSVSRTHQQNRFTLATRIFSLPLLFLLPVALLLALPWVVSSFSQARLGHQSFTELAQASLARTRLLDRLDFVQRRISRISRDPRVSNCTGYGDAAWRLEENVHLLHSQCDIYASHLEKVSVWGYAAKTGGILSRSLVDRSFTVLAGRVLEWQEGHLQYIVHPEGSSWTMRRWAASAILLDGNTWVLEYKRTPLFEGVGDMHGLMHLVKSVIAKVSSNMKLYMDTALFIKMQGLDVFADQAVSSASRLTPT